VQYQILYIEWFEVNVPAAVPLNTQ
jgi:hypothetical protein